jgi:hypothetical protein
LIDNRDIIHFQCCRASVRTNDESRFRDRNHPIQPGRGNRGMEIVNLVRRGSLPLK